MGSWVVGFDEIDRTMGAIAGGKGAALGELARIDGVRVPAGFCVTTDAFARVVAAEPSVVDLVERLDRLDGVGGARAADVVDDDVGTLAAELRRTIEAIAIPADVAGATIGALARLGEGTRCAVRSSATAEDLPTASFAGQQDSFLGVVGPSAVLDHVRRCWASLFTDRAIAYRRERGIEHARVRLAVVVQRLVAADAAGVLFTADPVTSNRRVVAIEATVGLGDTLVSGLVDVDRFAVRDGEIVLRSIATKTQASRAQPGGGVAAEPIAPARQHEPTLTDDQVLRLARLGRTIEAHLGRPQDIEWCLVGDELEIVQSRPITTLFPIPDAGDEAPHVYVSVGHQQMMTDALKPLGISVWQLTAIRPMFSAGGRLFVDVARELASPTSRAAVVAGLGRSDPLIGDALQTVVDRGLIPLLDDDGPDGPPPPVIGAVVAPAPVAPDPAIVTELLERTRASVAALQRDVETRSGPALLAFLRDDLQELKGLMGDPRSRQALLAGVEATWWLNEHVEAWLGDKNAADRLTQSVPHNVTSQMGLALLDVADAIRPHPEVVAFLEETDDDGFVEELPRVRGGVEARDALVAFLDAYGARGAGEIDVTRPRWREQPTALLPVILANVRNFEPGEAARRFEHGRREADAHAADLLARVRALPDGEHKAAEAAAMIDRIRSFIGYREHPKFGIVQRYEVYRQALLGEADRLVERGVLDHREDCFFLTFDELEDVVRTHTVDRALVAARREAHEEHRALHPPRVLTSDGEVLEGAYRRDDVPPGALVGLPVSAGVVEGRARVIDRMADADLDAGDILVTTCTDPSWSPVFVTLAGLVTEVGGAMTHGAVIAREYGLPAVVGVVDATTLIRDGERIRVDGTSGVVELVARVAPADRVRDERD